MHAPPGTERAPHRTGGRSRRGRSIVIAGPDGAGKSSMAAALADHLGSQGLPVRRYHHRLRALPSSAVSRRPTSTPHATPPYGLMRSIVKVLYLFADFQLGWWTRVGSFMDRGGWIIVERGWWDQVVDPRRYRLRGVSRLVRALAGLMPPVDHTIVLDVPPDELDRRVGELASAEAARQRRAWLAYAAGDPRTTIVDASRPVEAVAAAVVAVATGPSASGAERTNGSRPSADDSWVVLPPGGRPRWYAPITSRRSTEAALQLYQPMGRRALVAWYGARFVARGGGLRWLSRGAVPPEFVEAIAGHIPTGGSVAVALGRTAGHFSALLLDRDGRPAGFAKVAVDESGRSRLAHEAAALVTLGARLERPLRPPSIRAFEDGVLICEPIAWEARPRPWRLDGSLAHGLGRFHATGPAPGERGPGHGDLAPWNVFRSGDHWVLFDWEDATEDAPAFSDPLHYLVQSHALLGRPSRRELLMGITRGEGWVGAALAAYADGAGIGRSDLVERLHDHLETSKARLDPARADGRRGLVARHRLAEGLRSLDTVAGADRP